MCVCVRDGCSAVSCDFGVFLREDEFELKSFYFIIFSRIEGLLLVWVLAVSFRCVLAIIPLIWGVQLQQPLCTLGMVGQHLAPAYRSPRLRLLSMHSQVSGGSAFCLLVNLIVAAYVHLWSP